MSKRQIKKYSQKPRQNWNQELQTVTDKVRGAHARVSSLETKIGLTANKAQNAFSDLDQELKRLKVFFYLFVGLSTLIMLGFAVFLAVFS